MHIPDSAISPATSLAALGAMIPAWWVAGRRLRSGLQTREVPLLALGAAFGFTVMMFNVPAPGGTTVHPVGGVLLAVLLGPWGALAGMTVALVIQAVFFGDGGVLAAGANSLAMAFAMPFAGYAVYRLVSAGSGDLSRRRAVAAGIGAYAGINVAAVLVALLLGIQPVLHHDAAGRALYFPLGLAVTLPAMLLPHLTIAGAAEGILTGVAVRYLQTARIRLWSPARSERASGGRSRWVPLAAGLAALLLLTPLGLLARGSAWGEWTVEEISRIAGYLPERLAAIEASGWKGLQWLPDYLSERGPLAYGLSGLAGVILVGGLLVLIGLALTRRANAGRTGGGIRAGAGPATSVRPGELPGWMKSTDERPSPGRRSFRVRLRGRLDAKTLAAFAGAAHDGLLAETCSRRGGLLQRLDPRVKAAGLIGLVLMVGFLRSWPALVILAIVLTGLAACSGVPLRVFLARSWLAVPWLAGAAALPAALSVITPGEPLAVLSNDPYLAITRPGLSTAALLLVRVGLAISCVTLLTLTTRWNDLLWGLRVLLLPSWFLAILAAAYRYIAVLLQGASDLFLARTSRVVGRARRPDEWRAVARFAGALAGKTIVMAEEVHSAMVSRGWTGAPRSLRRERLGAPDAAWLVFVVSLGAVLMGITLLGP